MLQGSDETTMNALYVASTSQASGDDPSSETAKGCGGARIGQGQTNGSVPVLSLVGLLGFVRLAPPSRLSASFFRRIFGS